MFEESSFGLFLVREGVKDRQRHGPGALALIKEGDGDVPRQLPDDLPANAAGNHEVPEPLVTARALKRCSPAAMAW
jgi:hypothetical protein